MSKLVKSVTSPKKFITGKRLLENLNDYIEDYGDHAYIICDEFILERAQKEAGIRFRKPAIKLFLKNSITNAHRKKSIVTGSLHAMQALISSLGSAGKNA